MPNRVLWTQTCRCVKVWFDHDSKLVSHFFISHTMFLIIKVVVNLCKYLLSRKLFARHIYTCQNCVFLNTKLQVSRGYFGRDSNLWLPVFFISLTIFFIFKLVVNLCKYLLNRKLFARHICTCQNCAFLNTKLQVCRGVLWTWFKGLDSDFFHFSKYIYYQQTIWQLVQIFVTFKVSYTIYLYMPNGTFLKTK